MSSQNQMSANHEQTVLILVGLVASGKSTFAQALEQHFPQFRRCNQDDLGSRLRVEDLARRTLREGLSVCIDRTNFDARQRSHWINIAREFHGISVWVIVFDTPYQDCVIRLNQRMSIDVLGHSSCPELKDDLIAGTSHPTITDAQQGLTILQRFASDFQYPSPDEGYDRIIYLRPSDHPHPEYTLADISSILERLRSGDSSSGGSRTPIRSLNFPRGGSIHPTHSNYSRGTYNHRNFRSSYRGASGASRWRSGGRGRGSVRGQNPYPSTERTSRQIIPLVSKGLENPDKPSDRSQENAPSPPQWEGSGSA
ncbi:P-loop containing nucleoside triphosphate hydrolase protein [Hygrophoropsis aurantiaca]|uniref:P-loop containing nucleoside triphosphate hydrolase protein n=1 Tax=Hygrophoropsis aurantiaca TaxID=72124 RepID=A0ACB8AIJ1_9AGAM|nr:P-loop containing nucleoside triphosphate hydrolase protein [Hygrophoropsis aurantiaca]